MSRPILLVVLSALLGVLLLLPRPDAVRLAATQAGSVLLEPARPGLAPDRTVGGAEEGADPETETPGDLQPLWRSLVEGPTAARDADRTIVLGVRGYRVDMTRTAWKDQRLHSRFFESVERQLRAIAADEGFELRIVQKLSRDFDGVALVCTPAEGELVVEAQFPDGSIVHATREWHPTGALSLAPSLVAVFLAALLRRPLLALGAGVLTGVVLERVIRGVGWPGAAAGGSTRLVTHYLPGELFESTRQEILLFIVFMLAMVGIMTRAGGVRGLMDVLARLVRNARRTQIGTYFMGLAVFFDHHANAILVGTTMRPLTDRFRISREKLAYLVDSTAAPVAGISIFSTWIAFEVSSFSAQLPDAGLAASQGYEVFLWTLPFRFYSLLTLFFVGLVVFTGRDFGPMRRAEERARAGQVLRSGARPLAAQGPAGLEPATGVVARARTAILPLVTFVGTALAVILVGGGWLAGAAWTDALRDAGGSRALMVGAAAGLVVAAVVGAGAGLGARVFAAAGAGIRTAGPALALLVCAWTIGAICSDLGTAAYLSVVLQDALNPLVLPILLFAIAGAIAFATGSSWSTMAILLPLVVGIAHEAGESVAIGGIGLVVVSIASILEGAIFGDHCSPISDTTVMSSIASSADHVDHVKTQAPYAILVMSVALLCGYLPAVVVGLSPWISLGLGGGVLAVFLRVYGRRTGALRPEAPDEPGAADVPASRAAA